MNPIHAVSPLALVFILLGRLFTTGELLPATMAEESPDLRSWMIVLPSSSDADPEVFQIGPLEEGETRQFFTSAGEEITVSRSDEGRVFKVNGKVIGSAVHHGFVWVSKDDHVAHKFVRIDGRHLEHAEHVEVDPDAEIQKHISVHITKSHPPHIQVNTISTSEDGPQIVIIDRLSIEKEK